ncbi:tetratricopeptide repeat protein [Sulfitobacter aestuarii]|uniref:Tetratricopeptide repeat protein n=1 Tax=Sulfitobacter aestuarii TaxID=2161676 RepID=A0ABW5TZ11_9RHOB
MSNSDSFIDEVTEEVRRDRLFGLMRRYGWIAVLLVVLIVGGAAWNEYQKSRERAEAEALGDAMLAAMQADDSAARAAALDDVGAPEAAAAAVLGFLTAAEHAEAGDIDAAVARLDAVAVNGAAPEIYRQIAQFKALTLKSASAPAAERRQGFEAMAQPGAPLRLLAAEQLALIEIEENAPDAAIARYQDILNDAGTTPDLQQRALQVIVALGGEPELDASATDPAAGALQETN